MIIKTDNQNYTNIAAAIREKNGKTDKYKPSEMAIAIEAIDNKGIFCTLTITTTAGATVTATLNGKTVTATASSSGIAVLELPKEGSWTVTATADGSSVSIQVNTSLSLAVGLNFFPAAPSSYEYMALVTASQTWTAPESGYFQIEVFGASGNSGEVASIKGSPLINVATGGGGGSGGYAASRIKMNKGDTIALTAGAVGATTSAVINSSLESYSSPQVTSGINGANGAVTTTTATAGTGSGGGTASGGNYSNLNGYAGGTGNAKTGSATGAIYAGGAGGAAVNGGNAGGTAATAEVYMDRTTYLQAISQSGRTYGSAGFFKIYRGNTNLA